jgi:hypothetical protein
MQILIVDKSLKDYSFLPRGYHIDIIFDVSEALNKILVVSYDAIFLNVVFDGFLKEIKRVKPIIPVYLINHEDDEFRGMTENVSQIDGYIPNRFFDKRLIKTLDKLLIKTNYAYL